jgi:hypothetical protein
LSKGKDEEISKLKQEITKLKIELTAEQQTSLMLERMVKAAIKDI